MALVGAYTYIELSPSSGGEMGEAQGKGWGYDKNWGGWVEQVNKKKYLGLRTKKLWGGGQIWAVDLGKCYRSRTSRVKKVNTIEAGTERYQNPHLWNQMPLRNQVLQKMKKGVETEPAGGRRINGVSGRLEAKRGMFEF